MKARTVLGIVLVFALAQLGNAGPKNDIQKYFNNTACKVKAATDPVEKRVLLNTSLQTMSQALEKAERFGLISQNDRTGIDRFKTALQAKQDELNGLNGFDRVADAQLNAFADYVVQDMEQAAETVTISLIAALLIIIILILIV